jgi:hypothetical protein
MSVVAIVPSPTPARRPLDAIVQDTMKSATRRTSRQGRFNLLEIIAG